MKISNPPTNHIFESDFFRFKEWLKTPTLLSIIFWGLAAIATTPFISYPIDFGLDPSWIYFINKYHYFLTNNPYKFGLDVFFTYGPLGFVLYPNNGQLTYLIAIVVQFIYWALSLYLILKVVNQEKIQSFHRYVFIVSLLFLFANNQNIFILAFLLLLVLVLRDPLNSTRYLILALFTTCLMFYAKFNIGILFSTILFSLYLLLFVKRIWKIKSQYTAAYLFFYLIVLPTIYFVYSPSLKGLFQHFYYSVEIARGYSSAMSISENNMALPLSLTFILLYGLTSVYLLINGEETPGASLVIAPGLFFAFKSGFVRQDIYHYADFFNFYIISMALLFLITHKPKLIRFVGTILIQ